MESNVFFLILDFNGGISMAAQNLVLDECSKDDGFSKFCKYLKFKFGTTLPCTYKGPLLPNKVKLSAKFDRNIVLSRKGNGKYLELTNITSHIKSREKGEKSDLVGDVVFNKLDETYAGNQFRTLILWLFIWCCFLLVEKCSQEGVCSNLAFGLLFLLIPCFRIEFSEY